MPEDVHLTYESELQARKEYISELKKNWTLQRRI